VLLIFLAKQFKNAEVTTDASVFFQPARKMYQACGFREIKRIPGGGDSQFPASCLPEKDKVLIILIFK